MQIVSAVVSRSVDACWQVFTTPSTMTSWIPGLRRVQVLATRPDGLPLQIRFEYAADLVYSLVYTYDLDARVIRWEPLESQQGGVRGFARFSPVEDGTEVTYAIEHDGGRKAAERALDDPRILIEAFTRRMHEDRD